MDGVELSEKDVNGTNPESITESVDISHEPKRGIFCLFNNKLYVVVQHDYLGHV